NGSYTTGTGNRLTNDGVWTYTYDADGELIKKSQGTNAETWNYTYDVNHQMVTAEKHATDGGTLQMKATYTYDVLGRRIEKDVWATGGTTTVTRFAYDRDEIWADLNSDNNLTARYMRGNGQQ